MEVLQVSSELTALQESFVWIRQTAIEHQERQIATSEIFLWIFQVVQRSKLRLLNSGLTHLMRAQARSLRLGKVFSQCVPIINAQRAHYTQQYFKRWNDVCKPLSKSTSIEFDALRVLALMQTLQTLVDNQVKVFFGTYRAANRRFKQLQRKQAIKLSSISRYPLHAGRLLLTRAWNTWSRVSAAFAFRVHCLRSSSVSASRILSSILHQHVEDAFAKIHTQAQRATRFWLILENFLSKRMGFVMKILESLRWQSPEQIAAVMQLIRALRRNGKLVLLMAICRWRVAAKTRRAQSSRISFVFKRLTQNTLSQAFSRIGKPGRRDPTRVRCLLYVLRYLFLTRVRPIFDTRPRRNRASLPLDFATTAKSQAGRAFSSINIKLDQRLKSLSRLDQIYQEKLSKFAATKLQQWSRTVKFQLDISDVRHIHQENLTLRIFRAWQRRWMYKKLIFRGIELLGKAMTQQISTDWYHFLAALSMHRRRKSYTKVYDNIITNIRGITSVQGTSTMLERQRIQTAFAAIKRKSNDILGISRVERSTASARKQSPIENYSWKDEGRFIKVWMEFPASTSAPRINSEVTSSSINFTINKKVLHVKKLAGLIIPESSTYDIVENTIVLVLEKVDKKNRWYKLS